MKRSSFFARAAATLGCVLALTAAPSLAGERIYAPPGKAGASEYSEVVPTSGGNVKPPPRSAYTPSESAASAGPIAKLGSGVKGLRSDAKLGAGGPLAAGFAQSTAPTRVSAPAGVTAAGSGSALAAVVHLLSGEGGGGIGLALPLALVFALGLATGVAALRLLRGRA